MQIVDPTERSAAEQGCFMAQDKLHYLQYLVALVSISQGTNWHLIQLYACFVFLTLNRSSAWVFVGGMSYELTEGDLLCVMSQWGEIEDVNLVRDTDNGKSKGFAFLKYEVRLANMSQAAMTNSSSFLHACTTTSPVVVCRAACTFSNTDNISPLQTIIASNIGSNAEAYSAHF
jgi:RNA recognition motif. (a.k.a. RRM, RBD, or RNP domain)